MIKLMLWLIVLAEGWPLGLVRCPQVQHLLHNLSATALAIAFEASP